MRNAPHLGHGTGGKMPLICPTAQAKRLRQINTTGKSPAPLTVKQTARVKQKSAVGRELSFPVRVFRRAPE
jgi:hypothetical protein